MAVDLPDLMASEMPSCSAPRVKTVRRNLNMLRVRQHLCHGNESVAQQRRHSIVSLKEAIVGDEQMVHRRRDGSAAKQDSSNFAKHARRRREPADGVE